MDSLIYLEKINKNSELSNRDWTKQSKQHFNHLQKINYRDYWEKMKHDDK